TIELVVLTQNYRSPQAILDAAYRLIRHNNPERLEVKQGVDKRLQALREGRPAPVPFEVYSASTLATLAVAEALAALRRVDVDYQLLSPSAPPE
ncbi:MAG: hypothetical protein HYT96_04865, partial [Armatimonadetes bacterium]|nr:hypothetical protein [Armatimonadota bacterium]